MGSQFVDLNEDGHLDYVTATFDGSPHIAYGSDEGFGEPERILDKNGERVIIASIWDYEAEEHVDLGRALQTETPPSERCISALAFDWDADGDYDLLLGSYEKGHLYLQKNEGTNQEPKFSGINEPVMAGDQPFEIPEKMTAPRLVDWDGDGDLDLIAGSFGDCWGKGPGGAVYLSINGGKPGAPAFGSLQTLISQSAKDTSSPTRPDAGLYPDVVDWDGDGDLDLIVGGYSLWTPEGRELTADEQQRADQLEEQKQKLHKKMGELNDKMMSEVDAAAAGHERGEPEWMEKYKEISKSYREEQSALGEELGTVQSELDELVPSSQREGFIWLYERL